MTNKELTGIQEAEEDSGHHVNAPEDSFANTAEPNIRVKQILDKSQNFKVETSGHDPTSVRVKPPKFEGKQLVAVAGRNRYYVSRRSQFKLRLQQQREMLQEFDLSEELANKAFVYLTETHVNEEVFDCMDGVRDAEIRQYLILSEYQTAQDAQKTTQTIALTMGVVRGTVVLVCKIQSSRFVWDGGGTAPGHRRPPKGVCRECDWPGHPVRDLPHLADKLVKDN